MDFVPLSRPSSQEPAAGFTAVLGVVSGNNSASVSSPVWTSVSPSQTLNLNPLRVAEAKVVVVVGGGHCVSGDNEQKLYDSTFLPLLHSAERPPAPTGQLTGEPHPPEGPGGEGGGEKDPPLALK